MTEASKRKMPTQEQRAKGWKNLQRGSQSPGHKRAKFVPTDEQRAIVKSCAAGGLPQDSICLAIINPATKSPIDRKTLEKAFRNELDSSAVQANAQVIASLFKNAVTHNNVAAQIFWAKTRMGWRDVNTTQQLGADGKPVDPPKQGGVLVVPGMMDPKEWEALAADQQAQSVEIAGKKA